MSTSATPEEIKKLLEVNKTQDSKNPETMRYEFIGDLCKYNTALTDLNEKQIHVICAFTALDGYMRANGQEGLPVIMKMFEEFKLNRISLDRKSREELERILRPGTVIKSYGSNVGGETEEKKPGFFAKLLGGKKRDQ